jgi:hypothetical protein
MIDVIATALWLKQRYFRVSAARESVRNAQLSVALSALAPQALPMLHQVESAQMAAVQAKGQKVQTMAAGLAPTMDAAMKVAEKCGDDEACFMRESQKVIGAMQGNGQMAVLKQTQRDAAPLMKLDAPRYQYFAGATQSGKFQIDESVQVSVTDPICTSRPRHRCTRSEVRQGAGDLPAALPGIKPAAQANASVAAVEVDAVKGTLALRLPVVGLLPYTETITTDEPEGTHDTPTPKGATQKLLRFRITADDAITMDKPLIVPLAGGWRSQSGLQVVMLKGAFGNAGKLTVRWRLTAS